jgi:hypothetical protein
MSIREIVDLMDRYLPCPPDPMPEPDSDADFLWRATAFNASRDPPLRVVQLIPRAPELLDNIGTVRVRLVECDSRGRGTRLIG